MVNSKVREVLGPAAISANTHTHTHTGSEEDCVSREEFDRELGQVNAKLLGIKDELDVWQKTTVDLFRRYLLDNQGTCTCILSKCKDYPKP